MKRIPLVAACLLSFLCSCNKDLPKAQDEYPLEFSASLDCQVKTSWVGGDEISVTDAAGNSAVYSTYEIGPTVRFRLKAGQTVIGQGPYRARYGLICPIKKQTFSPGSQSAVLLKAESTTTSLNFTPECSVLELKLSGTEKISSVMIKGDDTALFTLSCAEPVDISSTGSFVMALPAGCYRRIYLTNSDGLTRVFSTPGGYSLEAGKTSVIEFSDIDSTGFDSSYLGTSSEEGGYPLLFALRNIAAENPEDSGEYFVWGGTTGYHFSNNYWRDASNTIYSFVTKPVITENLRGSNDAATVLWGNDWRMPTEEEMSALKDLPSEWKQSWGNGGKPGRLIYGPQGNSVFFPAAGYAKKSEWLSNGEAGYYWTSSVIPTKLDSHRYAFQINDDNAETSNRVKTYNATNYFGFPIRPVKNTPVVEPGSGEKELNILIYGHSYGQDCTEYLPRIALAEGFRNIRIGRFVKGNCSMEEHWSFHEADSTCFYSECEPGKSEYEKFKLSSREVIAQRQWDYVIFQNSLENEGRYETAQPWLNNLVKFVRDTQKNKFGKEPVICWNMFWPISKLAEDGHNSTLTYRLSFYGNSSQKMWEAYMEAAQELSEDTGIDFIIPTGTAVMNARTTSLNTPEAKELTRDTYHMSYNLGRYVVACTFFEKMIAPLRGTTVLGNSYRVFSSSIPLMSDRTATILQRCAVQAVQHPYTISRIEE